MLNFSADTRNLMTSPHQHVAEVTLSAVAILAPVGVVLAWLLEKLPSIAAAVSIAFIVWQWRRMIRMDRLKRESTNEPESDTAS